MTTIYTISDINNIMFQGFEYRLPEQNIKIISDLEKLMGTTEIPVFKTKTHDKKHTRHPTIQPINNDDWSVVRTSFKPTIIDVKEGIDQDVNIIRTSLNKISIKNFESQRNIIIDFIMNFMEKQSSSELLPEEQLQNINRIGHSIFDIASTNKNNSMLYASLYKDLIQKFDYFSNILTEFVNNFKKTIQNIKYVNPDVNYDEFCAYTKINDLRKATTLFLINLMKIDLVSHNIVIDIIQFFQETVIQYIEESGRTNEIEEIIENIFILISQSKQELNTNENWDTIIDLIKTISLMKIKEHPSLTNRAVFKCLDILDSLA